MAADRALRTWLTLGVGLIAAILVAACGASGVTEESHEELAANVRELKSEVKDLARTTAKLERDAGGGEQVAATADEHGAAASGDAHGGAVHWAYTGSEGPATWGDLSADFGSCGAGVNQSPINVASTTGVGRGDISFRYGTSSLTVINNGHTIQANVDSGNTIAVDGVSYELAQFHFHAPSEHTFDGAYFALEMHLVHVGAFGDLAVVGVVFDRGATSSVLAPVWADLPADTTAQSAVARFDLRTLIPANASMFRYSGSLTTPPCSEGVRWMLLQKPGSVSVAQAQAFGDIVGANNRPVQPLNAREVLAETGVAFSANR